MGYIVEIEEGGLTLSVPFEPMTENLLCAHVRSKTLVEVPLPPHPFETTAVVAYRAGGAEEERRPNCRVPGRAEPVRGVLIIVGRDRGGSHRFLSLPEARVYRMEREDDEAIARLVIGTAAAEAEEA